VKKLSEYVVVEKRLLKEILLEIGELKKLVNERCLPPETLKEKK